MGGLFSRSRTPPAAPNPSVAEIEAKNRAEQAKRDAEAAKALAEKVRREALEQSQRMEANLKAVTAAADAARQDAQKTRDAMVASENRAKAAQEAAAAAAATQQEELKRITEELKQAREAIEKARQAEVAAKAEAERKWAAAEEERRKAEAARADADRATRAAREEAQKATAAKEEAEKRWKAGIQPVVTPSLEELEKVKRRIQYKEGIFHFAVAGVAGSGKSSLINAFRGLRNRDASAAATGVTETTLAMARYPDANPQHPFVWFDIPGAGTLKIPDWQYFNAQGLYVFDCIIVLFDNRFTMTDVAILSNAKRFKIPTYMVRSKADQHIRNLMRDMGYDSEQDDEDDPGRRARLLTAARKQYIEETRKSVKTNMENAGLPDQRVYIVSNDNVLGMVKGNTPRRAIDEVALLTDLFTEAHVRRGRAINSQGDQ
ncbi:interferon-inducible GTPase-domain-containing protein [Pisolithus croceorrhizus]|nr:interferon-inducible GTPase-domain-containing protein [Pisolithus croceorrhizus]